MLRYYVFLFIALLVTACAAPRDNPGVTPAPTLMAATDIPTLVPSVPTTVETFVPKHNDLIFIEFFAVT